MCIRIFSKGWNTLILEKETENPASYFPGLGSKSGARLASDDIIVSGNSTQSNE